MNVETEDTFYVSNLKQTWLVRMKCKSLLTDKVSNIEDINSELDKRKSLFLKKSYKIYSIKESVFKRLKRLIAKI